MKAPGFWHMAFASLVSAFSWTPLGRSAAKHYLTTQRDAVLNSEAMQKARRRSFAYHNIKNWWPTFWEEAREPFNAEEMPSKWHSYCAVIAGMILAFPIGLIAGILI